VIGLAVAIGVLAVASVVGLWWRRRDGRILTAPPAGTDRAGQPETPAGHPELAALGVVPGTPVTLLQFSSAFCAPCRVTRRVCAQLASAVGGVEHLEVDAESHLHAVRALDVWRTTTVLVIDPAGRIVYRVVGAPGPTELAAAIAPMLAATAA